MLFLLSSKWRWPMGKTSDGKVVFSKDYVPPGLGFLLGANVCFAVAWYERGSEVLLPGEGVGIWVFLGAAFFLVGTLFILRRKWLTFDPASRTVIYRSRRIAGTRRRVFGYGEVEVSVDFEPSRGHWLIIVLPDFHTNLAGPKDKDEILGLAREFSAETGIETELLGALRAPAPGTASGSGGSSRG